MEYKWLRSSGSRLRSILLLPSRFVLSFYCYSTSQGTVEICFRGLLLHLSCLFTFFSCTTKRAVTRFVFVALPSFFLPLLLFPPSMYLPKSSWGLISWRYPHFFLLLLILFFILYLASADLLSSFVSLVLLAKPFHWISRMQTLWNCIDVVWEFRVSKNFFLKFLNLTLRQQLHTHIP